uniref:Uncharacterized protein n=1 Tax=Pseudo-nitzschia australis TaxID=44445 RepID=A0A7S4AQV4_9STRA|mmetsp:Transcript_25913/g.56797  ORF Transcript_25913/g.56797 Transcript_25913/m.56797 type:complete len:373 (+) Transcript_25913:224-1342(+)
MRQKTMKINLHNVLIGILLILGLPFNPKAFDIIPRHTLLSTRCSTVATTAPITTTTSHARMITATCADKNNEWGMNHNNDCNAGAIVKIVSRPNQFPWLVIAILVFFRKLLPVPDFNASLGQSLVSQCQQQVEIPGISFFLFGLVTGYSSSISSWYMDLLTRSPLWTKTVTTSLIAVVGDTFAQYIERRKNHSSPVEDKEDLNKDKDSAVSNSSIGSPFFLMKNYDKRRGLSCMGENMLISGPLLHFSYNLMEAFIPTTNGGRSAIFAALTHALIDNFVLDTIFLATMFVSTGIAEGYVREIIPQFRKDFFPTLRMGWLAGICLLPVQFLLFRFFPLSLRVLGVNIIDIFWGAYVSYMVHRRRRQPQENNGS